MIVTRFPWRIIGTNPHMVVKGEPYVYVLNRDEGVSEAAHRKRLLLGKQIYGVEAPDEYDDNTLEMFISAHPFYVVRGDRETET